MKTSLYFWCGGFFCYLFGIGVQPPNYVKQTGIFTIGVISAGITGAAIFFCIAYIIKGIRKPRDWTAVGRWFFWISLIGSVGMAAKR